jgi:SAM-dependent methyltransferase
VALSSPQVVSSAVGEKRDRRNDAVVWHELECGSYSADLSLWLELASLSGGAILDIGAGTGRVARVLAQAARRVTALERDPELLARVGTRRARLPIELVCADARCFSLPRRDFDLCIVPMHTIQLLGDDRQRAEFLRCAREHLRPTGLLACALLPDAEPFDCRRGDVGPVPERTTVAGLRYVSAAVRVEVDERLITIERERKIMRVAASDSRAGAGAREQELLLEEREVSELARVGARQFEQELVNAGLRPLETRQVPATSDHVGSEVVLARV